MFIPCQKPKKESARPLLKERNAFALLWLAVLIFGLSLPSPTWALLSTTSDSIKQTKAEVDAELSELPPFLPTTAPWTLGYSSKPLTLTNAPHTIEVVFPKAAPIDLIVLMPAAFSDEENKLRAFGFPKSFIIERLLTNGVWETVADYRKKVYSTRGIEPQLFPCQQAKMTQKVRLTSTKPSKNQTWWSAEHLVAMGEIFAFAGEWNVSLNAKVKVPNNKWMANIWSHRCLVDGFTMFAPVDRRYYDPTEQFFVYTDQLTVLFDLGEIQPIDEVRLWPVVLSLQHNYPSASGIGFPTGIKIETLTQPNDPKPVAIYNTAVKLPQPGSTPFMHRVTATESRYIRLILSRGIPEFGANRISKIALSEIELLYKGNLLTGNKIAKITVNNPVRRRDIRPKLLTDGLTSEGRIIPLRRWIETFRRQSELKIERNKLRKNLDLAEGQEKERMTFFMLAAIALIIILSLMIWVVRLLAARRWARMREKIACDLHDEVGANLSSIAHSTELMRELIPDPSAMQMELMENAITTARTTAKDTRQFIQLLEQRDTGLTVVDSISKIAQQILGPIEHQCNFSKSKVFNQLDPSRQWDLFFFIKESLNNILKHAEATHVKISTYNLGHAIRLIIEDNGCGIPENRFPLRHLESRAKHMKGALKIETGIGQGTKIILTLKKWKN